LLHKDDATALPFAGVDGQGGAAGKTAAQAVAMAPQPERSCTFTAPAGAAVAIAGVATASPDGRLAAAATASLYHLRRHAAAVTFFVLSSAV